MDKNVLNVSYYDTKTKTGGNVQIQQPAGNKLLSQILDAAKPVQNVINIVIPEPKYSPIPGLIKKVREKKQSPAGGFVKPTDGKVQEGQHPSSRLAYLTKLYSHHGQLTEEEKLAWFKAPTMQEIITSDIERHAFFNSQLGCPSAHSDVDAIQEDYKCTLIKGVVFPTYDQAKEYAETRILPNFGKLMTEIKAEKTADEKAMEKEKTFKIKKLNKPLVIMFNGPPRSGKDSACEIIMEHFPEVHYAYFKEVLYKECAKILGLDFNFWASVCQNGDLKDKPMLTMAAGETGAVMTPRDILIYLAEKVLKPKYGRDFIACETAETISGLIQFQREQSNEEAVIVVPDLGFDYEIDTVRKKIPDAHVISVAVHRPGFTFEGDSRNYVKDPGFGLHNTGSYEDLENKVLRLFRNIVMDIRPIPTIETM